MAPDLLGNIFTLVDAAVVADKVLQWLETPWHGMAETSQPMKVLLKIHDLFSIITIKCGL